MNPFRSRRPESVVSGSLVGTEWIVDALGCRADLLRDETRLRGLCEEVIRDLDLHVVNVGHWHVFPFPGGVTGLYLLSESHLACHTYPEWGIATINLYCCRSRPVWPWKRRLRSALGASRVRVRSVHRGFHAQAAGARAEEGTP